MKCPHCGYTSGWCHDEDKSENHEKEGDFYKLPISLECSTTDSYYRDKDVASVHGCPSCNKIFMAYGIECRLPFLHTDLVSFALSLKQDAVQAGKSRPKAVIQEAVRGFLPSIIIDRPKLAFQDGLGLKKRIETILPDPARFYRAEHQRIFKGVEA